MAAANQLNRIGYEVTVFEKDESVGGLLRFGIPNFKLNKAIIDRRIEIMKAEGVIFKTNSPRRHGTPARGFRRLLYLHGNATGTRLDIPGRNLKGIRFALEMLAQQNRIFDVQLRTSEHRSMYSYVRLSIDRCTATYV